MDSMAVASDECVIAAISVLPRTVSSRGDNVQQHSQVDQGSGERRITNTIVPMNPGQEIIQAHPLEPPHSSDNRSSSQDVRSPLVEIGLVQGLIQRTTERRIQPFVRPPIAQISPGQGTRLVSGIADRGNQQEQKKGETAKLGLRRRFESGPKFSMNSQQENLASDKRQSIPNALSTPSSHPIGVTQNDALAQELTSLRRTSTSDALMRPKSSYSDVGQANLFENEIYGETPKPCEDTSTGSKKPSSDHRDKSSPSNTSDSLLWNIQREAPSIAERVAYPMVSASNEARNRNDENRFIFSSKNDSRIKNTSGSVRNVVNSPSKKSSVTSEGPTSSASLGYMSRGLSQPPVTSSINGGAVNTRVGEPVRQTRKNTEPSAKSIASSSKSRIQGDIDSQIDSIIGGTSKRLREIQEDCGNGSLESYNKRGGYDHIDAAPSGLSSEGPEKKRPLERDCNVPAFIAALERDSHSLASALCRSVSDFYV